MTALSRRSALRLWLGSFFFVAFVALWYFHAPLWPLLIAGAVTLILTLIRRSQ